MKYAFLSFMLLVSVSAFTANNSKTKGQVPETTATNPPTAKPTGEPSMVDNLMRGELAAMKAYDAALKTIKDKNQKETLLKMRDHHEYSASALSKYVAGKPDLRDDANTAGALGKVAENWVAASAKSNKEDGALKALKQAEQLGIKQYEEALQSKTMPEQLRQTIKSEIIPQKQKHIETLSQFI